MVSADIVVADDTATARHLASSYGHWVHSIRAGDGAVPYPDPDTTPPLSPEQRRGGAGPHRLRSSSATPTKWRTSFRRSQRLAGADELVVTSVTHGHADRLRSHELIAKRWGLT